MLLFSMNDMLAKTSLFSTASPSKCSLWLSLVKVSIVLPMTLRADDPSTWCQILSCGLL